MSIRKAKKEFNKLFTIIDKSKKVKDIIKFKKF